MVLAGVLTGRGCVLTGRGCVLTGRGCVPMVTDSVGLFGCQWLPWHGGVVTRWLLWKLVCYGGVVTDVEQTQCNRVPLVTDTYGR